MQYVFRHELVLVRFHVALPAQSKDDGLVLSGKKVDMVETFIMLERF